MSDFARLMIFKELAEQRSFVKTASLFKVSSAAISKQISALEDELQVQLFERSTRRVALTELGLLYLEQIRPILASLEEADLLISQIHKKPTGRLRVFAARQFGESYLIPYLSEFLQKYPDVKLDIELGERIPDMAKERIDIMIGSSISGTADCIQKTVAKTRYILCASPNYLKKMGSPQSLEELAQHRYITHSMRKPDNEIVFSKEMRVHVEPYLRLNDSQSMLRAALEGLGIVYLHEYVVRNAIEKKTLERVLKKIEGHEIPLYLCYQAQRFVLPKIRAFTDFITEKAKLKKL